jgi:hypothetical protein
MSDARTEIHSANIVSDACPVPEPVAAVREPRVRRGASSWRFVVALRRLKQIAPRT